MATPLAQACANKAKKKQKPINTVGLVQTDESRQQLDYIVESVSREAGSKISRSRVLRNMIAIAYHVEIESLDQD